MDLKTAPISTPPPGFGQIILLIFAAESIFLLPFLLARIFRPTFLAVFEITNFELGTLYSTYGVVALLSYLYGGTLADRYSPRKLMATSLVLTAAGGILMTQYPSLRLLQILYGFWGFSTIFLFWAAMIKTTRKWGGHHQQGRAFGYLEGGRGLVAALIGGVGVYLLAAFLPNQEEPLSIAERQASFQSVIWFTTALVALVGLVVFFFLDDTEMQGTQHQSTAWHHIKTAAQYNVVWYLIVIVVCAYCGYKVTDILSLYAAEVMGFGEVDAAKVSAFQMYLRPLVCVSVGYLADRQTSSKWIFYGFVVLLFSAAAFASGKIVATYTPLFIGLVVTTGFGVYSLRTLYFSVIKEGKIPFAITGTAVGMISVVGYTPDIFMGPVMGYFLDEYPGMVGHQKVFLLLAAFALVGSVVAFILKKMVYQNHA